MDTKYRFSIKSLFRNAWQHFKLRPWFFIAITLFSMILSMLFDSAGEHIRDTSPIVGFFFSLATFFIEIIVTAGYFSILLDSLSGKTPVFSDLFSPRKNIWYFLGAIFLTGIIVTFGIIALIIPGLLAIATFYFASFIVIDRGIKPIAALKESARITKGVRLQVFQFIIALCILNLLGAIAFGVGLILTYPVSMIAYTLLYKELSLRKTVVEEKKAEEAVQATTV